MPSRIAEDRLSEAVLQFVQESAYPEDEDVVSAELPPSALTSLSKLLDQARIDVKVSEREEEREREFSMLEQYLTDNLKT